MNLSNLEMNQLTYYEGIDTAPSYSLMVNILHLNQIEVGVKKYI